MSKAQKRIDQLEAQRARLAGEIAEAQREREQLEAGLPALYAAAELEPSTAKERAVTEAERKLADLRNIEARKRAAISSIAADTDRARDDLRLEQIAELRALDRTYIKRGEKDGDAMERAPYADHEDVKAEAVAHWLEACENRAKICDLEGDSHAAAGLRRRNEIGGGVSGAPYRDPRIAFKYWLSGRKGKRPILSIDWTPRTMRAAMFEQMTPLEIVPGRRDP